MIDCATSAGSRALVPARLDELTCPWLCEIPLPHVFPGPVRSGSEAIGSIRAPLAGHACRTSCFGMRPRRRRSTATHALAGRGKVERG